ncbi:MAG: type II secretion system protein [Pseudomonadota bacterium]|nr:type II secretion system protein [Pseudomonadota bacterium]
MQLRARLSGGFTYVGLLLAVVLLGLALSAVGTVWHTMAQREREKELLFIGHEFKAAIAAYYRVGGQFPQDLADLVEDKRGPEPRHFLRHLYADPITGQADWTAIRADSQGITGVASSSNAVPIKKFGFQSDEEAFADADTYQDWKFVYVPSLGRRKLGATPRKVH